MTEDLKEFQQTITDITELHLYVTPSMATEYYIDLYDRFFDEIGNSRLILHSTTFPQMLKEADKSQNNLFLTPLAITNEMQLLLHNLLEKNNFDSIAFQPVRNYLCMHKSSRYANFTAPTLNDVIDVPIYVFLNTNPLCMSGDDPMMSLQYFSDYTVLKRNIKKHHAVGVLKKYEFNYYFGENNSEYILKPLNDLKMQYIVIGSEEILHKNLIVQDFVHFLQNTLKD